MEWHKEVLGVIFLYKQKENECGLDSNTVLPPEFLKNLLFLLFCNSKTVSNLPNVEILLTSFHLQTHPCSWLSHVFHTEQIYGYCGGHDSYVLKYHCTGKI